MNKLYIILTITLFLFSCSDKEENTSYDSINSKKSNITYSDLEDIVNAQKSNISDWEIPIDSMEKRSEVYKIAEVEDSKIKYRYLNEYDFMTSAMLEDNRKMYFVDFNNDQKKDIIWNGNAGGEGNFVVFIENKGDYYIEKLALPGELRTIYSIKEGIIEVNTDLHACCDDIVNNFCRYKINLNEVNEDFDYFKNALNQIAYHAESYFPDRLLDIPLKANIKYNNTPVRLSPEINDKHEEYTDHYYLYGNVVAEYPKDTEIRIIATTVDQKMKTFYLAIIPEIETKIRSVLYGKTLAWISAEDIDLLGEDSDLKRLKDSKIDRKEILEENDIFADSLKTAAMILSARKIYDKYYIVYSKFEFEYPKKKDRSYSKGVFFSSIYDSVLANKTFEYLNFDTLNFVTSPIDISKYHTDDEDIIINKLEIEGNDSSKFYISISLPDFSDFKNHLLLSISKTETKLIFEHNSYANAEDFKTSGDSILYFYYTSRDEIVDAYQHDYYFEYNFKTGETIDTLPGTQVINWNSKVMKQMDAYKTFEDAYVNDKRYALPLKVGTEVYLDTLNRIKKVLKLKLKNGQIRYINTEKFENRSLSTNAIG